MIQLKFGLKLLYNKIFKREKLRAELKCKTCGVLHYDTWNTKQIILTKNCILCEGKKSQ